MAKTAIDIYAEPTGECYARLLNFCAQYCTKFLVVKYDEPTWEQSSVDAALRRLEPFLLYRRRGQEWPGTGTFYGQYGILSYHRLEAAAIGGPEIDVTRPLRLGGLGTRPPGGPQPPV